MGTEVHHHYDAEGTYTGRTEVERESPWDETSRGRAMRLYEYDQSLCKCGCGQPASIAYSTEYGFLIDSAVCQAGKAMERHKRTEREKNANSPEGWDDGRHYYVAGHELIPESKRPKMPHPPTKETP